MLILYFPAPKKYSDTDKSPLNPSISLPEMFRCIGLWMCHGIITWIGNFNLFTVSVMMLPLAKTF
jgi:hypothetical protein